MGQALAGYLGACAYLRSAIYCMSQKKKNGISDSVQKSACSSGQILNNYYLLI